MSLTQKLSKKGRFATVSEYASETPITLHDTIIFYCQDRLTNKNTPGKKSTDAERIATKQILPGG